ncbi:MBL fold metallo-hydrolase [Salinicoccus halodurans]|uniref:Glyoxylase, beta-lactamase superfamily II n=1 Tax=Salinicoccus halodurans TaxID=407035 RepID=A0A0F7HLB3_9STAP|nr:MBL fold metallo-hydrolase [Salinicoccus halodurans]AKG74012.1 hydroxyacylglutathione hydrolase [Salinicoccus halodurans]SFK59177.1 Glyoxylase, beta-lactamase superfamily II [Salinicoccus halodurans]
MDIRTLPLGMLETNCYILNNGTGVLIIDPSGEAEVIAGEIEKIGLPVEGILLTHAHFDHIGALEETAWVYGADTWVGSEEADWLSDPDKNGSGKYKSMGMEPISAAVEPNILEEGSMQIGSFEFEVINTPGHSPGSMSFLFGDFVVSGDVLFSGGIGRTDLYMSNHIDLINSIREKLYVMDEDTDVYPGHGPATTIGQEKSSNPFVRG